MNDTEQQLVEEHAITLALLEENATLRRRLDSALGELRDITRLETIENARRFARGELARQERMEQPATEQAQQSWPCNHVKYHLTLKWNPCPICGAKRPAQGDNKEK